MRDIEKIARAICGEIKGLPDPDVLVSGVGRGGKRTPAWESQLPKARAAIEALTPAIMKVFRPYLSPEYSIPESITARQIHDDMEAMLRAILDEKQ